jgi:flagellar hook-associated protein FlgK
MVLPGGIQLPPGTVGGPPGGITPLPGGFPLDAGMRLEPGIGFDEGENPLVLAAIFADVNMREMIYNAINAYNNYLEYRSDQRTHDALVYNHEIQKWSINNCMIPKTMMQLDEIFNSMVRMINDLLSPKIEDPPGSGIFIRDPDAPFDNNGNQSFMEVFTRKDYDRWTRTDPSDPTSYEFNPEEPGNWRSFYSIGNVMINPRLLDTDGGYNYLALSRSGDIEDPTLLLELQEIWRRNSGPYAINIGGNYYSIQNAYINFVNSVGTEVNEAKNYVAAQTIQVNQAENRRQSTMGVSLDEEMKNMMKFQYAYQSAARILNVIDSMIDRVINGMGRSGI